MEPVLEGFLIFTRNVIPLHLVYLDQLVDQSINIILGRCFGTDLEILYTQRTGVCHRSPLGHFSLVLQVNFVAHQDHGHVVVHWFLFELLDFVND